MGADSEGELSSRMFPVLDPATLKENINKALEVGGTLVEGFALGSVEEEVVITSMFAATHGAIVARVALSKLSEWTLASAKWTQRLNDENMTWCDY